MTGLRSTVLDLLCVCGQMVSGAEIIRRLPFLACLVPGLGRLQRLGVGRRRIPDVPHVSLSAASE